MLNRYLYNDCFSGYELKVKTEMEKNFTTSRETILSLIQAVRREVEVKKKISASDEELAQKINDMLQEEDKVFATEAELDRRGAYCVDIAFH